MNCWDAEQLFDAYLDGQLSGTLRLELDAHRLRCPRCRQALAMMDACAHVISTDESRTRVSEDFTDRVMATIATRQAAPVRTFGSGWFTAGRRRLFVAAVAQAAAVALFVMLWPSGRNATVVPAGRGPVIVAAQPTGNPLDIAKAVDRVNSRVSAARATLASDAGGWASVIFDSLSIKSDVTDLLTSNPLASLLIGLPPMSDAPAPVASNIGSL